MSLKHYKIFTQETIDFLIENRMQNSKAWYDEHKADYRQYVFEPFANLVTLLAPIMLSIDDMLIYEPKVDKSISRIYRDIRFSKDKSLYRDVMWCASYVIKNFMKAPLHFSLNCRHPVFDMAAVIMWLVWAVWKVYESLF